MSLKTRGILVLVIGSILGVSLSVGGGMLANRAKPPVHELTWEQARLLTEVMDRVKRDYVDPIDDAELLENAIRGMVADLDRHSAFLDAEEYQDIRVSTTGRYSGRQPASTALIATFSTVAGAMFGGTTATTSCGSRRVPVSMRSTRSGVGGTTGSPSLQLRS